VADDYVPALAVTYAYCATAVRDESSDIATLTLTIALTLYTITVN